MKKLLTSLFLLMFTLLCIPACAFAATDFYAMEINEDNGETIGEKLYSVDLRGEQSIFLVFYSGDELIDREDLEIKGLYPDTEAVAKFIDDIYASNKANKQYEYEYEYEYEDNLIKYYALRDFHDRPYHYIKFYDDGIFYNPLENEDPNVKLSVEERDIGGLGIFMVKKLAQNVEYKYEDNKNILKVVISIY